MLIEIFFNKKQKKNNVDTMSLSINYFNYCKQIDDTDKRNRRPFVSYNMG